MNTERIELEKAELQKLLSAGNGDVALLHLDLRCGTSPAQAAARLGLSHARFSCAAATLRQLGLWPEAPHTPLFHGERPSYTERDVVEAMDHSGEFRLLYGEIQRLLGKSLNTEELKILLGFQRYLGLPNEVVSVLVSYCKERSRQQGKLRSPSLRTIEKEAYAWAEAGIDTLEAAASHIQVQNQRSSRLAHLMSLLQIRGRSLTPAEERYAQSWLELGLEDEVISMAYERTCLNTGGLNWPYMNKILLRWSQAGLRTAEQVRSGDGKAGKGTRQLDADEQAAIRRMMQEG